MDRMQAYYKNSLLANLCNEYKGQWKVSMKNKKALFDLAMQQQSIPHLLTFTENGLGLTKEYIKDEFCDYINGKYTAIDVDGVKGNYKTTIYVDYNGNIIYSGQNDVMTLMWCSDTTLQIPQTKAIKIYIGCKSDVKIALKGYNNATIMLFDESKVYIDECDETNKVSIYKYNPQTKAEIDKYCLAKVKINEKELRL